MTQPSPRDPNHLIAAWNALHSGSQPQTAPSRPQAKPTPEQLIAAWHNSNPGMSTLEDWGRSAVTGLEKGATAFVGLPHTLQQGYSWLQDHFMGGGTDLGADLTHLVKDGRPATDQERKAYHDIVRAAQAASPSTAGLDRVVQQAAGPYHTPQSRGGRYAETGGEMASGALLPGSALVRAARVAVPALTAQTASELAPDKYKGLAKLAGAIVGGGAQGFGERLGEAPYATLSRAAPNLTKEQIGLATALRADAANRGVQLTIPEAVQQVTGGATGMGRVQRLVENSNRTAPTMAGYFAQRPDQVQSAIGDFTQGVAPNMNPRPGMVAMDSQKGAQGALDFTRQSINDAAEPSYTALRGQTIPGADYAALANNDAYRLSLRQLRQDPVLGGKLKGLPDNDLSVVNAVVKQLDRNGTANAQTALNPAGNNERAAAFSTVRKQADALADAVSGDWRDARGTVAAGRASALDPLQAGPVGKIAATDDLGAQTGALYPSNPGIGAPLETSEAVGALGTQNPDIAAALTRQHLERAANQVAVDSMGRPDQYAGAKFVRNTMGNPEQGATLRAGLGALDPTGGFSDNLSKLADALQATGWREKPGSMTAFNAEDQSMFKKAPAVMRFIGTLGDPLEWTKNLSNWSGGVAGAHKLDVLADILRDPDTAAILRRAQMATPSSGLSQFALPAATQTQGAGP